MVGLLAQVRGVDGLNKVSTGHGRQVNVNAELQLPGTHLRVAV